MFENTNQSDADADAEFIGWQGNSRRKNFALYNIIAECHPSYGSTVTEESLREMKLKVPHIPHPHRLIRNL